MNTSLVRLIGLGGIAATAIPLMAVAQSDIVSRKAWGAKPAIVERMRAHRITGIMIHHTSVRQQPRVSLEKKMRGLQGFSQRSGKVGRRAKPAWGDVPYHFYIGVSGRTAAGRDLTFAGDTNTRYEPAGWIQIVVEGDFKADQPRPAQLAALRRLSAHLKTRFAIPGTRIVGHNDRASTDCPGPNLKRHLPALR